MKCLIIYDPVSIHQVTSLPSILINCDIHGFICSLPCEGPVSVLPQGCQSKVIWGGEPDTPSKAAQGELRQRPQEKDIKDLWALSCCSARFPKITPNGRMDITLT